MQGYAGGITILKDFLQEVRPQFLAAQTYQRTTYLPGEMLLMVGTDVPGMGTYYFALIVMFILLIRKELGRPKLSKPGVLREG